MSLAPLQKYPEVSFAQPFYHGQEDRVEELNQRIANRFSTDSLLEVNYSPRPVPTKCVKFPIFPRSTPLAITKTVEQENTVSTQAKTAFFNPGNCRGPTSGYMSNVRNENILLFQSQFRSTRDEGLYVPSSESSLYRIDAPTPGPWIERPYPLLFQKTYNGWEDTTGSFLQNYPTVGAQLFNNDTRGQLKFMD